MKLLNRFTLSIKNPEIARKYKLSYTNKIFVTGIILTAIRLLRLSFSFIVADPNKNDILFIPEYDDIKWVALAVQGVLVVAQRIYPEKLNLISIPLWITISLSTLDISGENPYTTYSFLFK